MNIMDFQNKNSSRRRETSVVQTTPPDSGSVFEKPEPIFEDVVGKKYPGIARDTTQEESIVSEIPEEVPADITSAQEVDRPAADVLNSVPSIGGTDSRQKYIFVGAVAIVFVLVLGLLIFVFGRGGGSGDNTAVTTPVSLTYWGLWEDEKVVKPIFDAYTKENPHVTIVYDKRNPKEYLTLLLGRSPNGKGPDIFRFHNTWIPQLTVGILSSIPQEVMTTEEFEKTFYKVHQEDLKLAGSYVGIPLYVDGLVLLYNPSILKAAGNQNPPTSFVGDLVEIATSVTVKGEKGPVTSGIALGTSNNVEHFSEVIGIIMLLDNLQDQKNVSNAWATNVFHKTISDNSQMERGGGDLRIFREFEEQGIWSADMPNSIDAFAQGKVAMIFAPTWQIPVIKAKNPDLSFAVAPVPQGLQGRRLTLASYWVEGVSKYSPHQLEAWKLLKYMSSSASQEKIFALQKQFRGTGMAYSRVDMRNKLVDDPELGPLLINSDAMVSLPLVTRTFDSGLNDGVVEYLSKAVTDSSKGVSYTSAFSQAAQGIKKILEEKYQIKLNTQ
jgi:multiple sugar transport system substrate-binding protein